MVNYEDIKNDSFYRLGNTKPTELSCSNCELYNSHKNYEHCGDCKNFDPSSTYETKEGGIGIVMDIFLNSGKVRRTLADLLKEKRKLE